MAQEVPVVQNKRLLVVACVLGLLAVALVLLHDSMLRSSLQGDKVMLLHFTTDLKAGDPIKAANIEVVPVPRDQAASFGNVMTRSDYDWAITQTVDQPVQKNQWLVWSMVYQEDARSSPTAVITPGMEGYTLQLDIRETPGDILRIGDHVNVYGTFSVNSKPPQSYPILQGVRILRVGERGPKERAIGGSSNRMVTDESVSNYRTIMIELSPDVSRKLDNLLSHGPGGVKVRPLNPAETYKDPAQITINPELEELTRSAAGPAGRGS